ncbi:MAG: hypothetical protein Q9181_004962 [Wetmoreana brouardii]
MPDSVWGLEYMLDFLGAVCNFVHIGAYRTWNAVKGSGDGRASASVPQHSRNGVLIVMEYRPGFPALICFPTKASFPLPTDPRAMKDILEMMTRLPLRAATDFPAAMYIPTTNSFTIPTDLRAMIDIAEMMTHGRYREPPFTTTCLMVIHKPDGTRMNQVAKLDTGASRNCISRRLASSIGATVEAYHGPSLEPAGNGPLILPIGELMLDWHVFGKERNYTSTFAIWEDHDCRNKFDIIIGEEEIVERRIYTKNNDVLFIQ